MVALFLKKKVAGGSSGSSGSSKRDGSRNPPSQLVNPVSPFEEFLPSVESFRFQKSFKMVRRKHSTQRDQLAQLKANEIMRTTEVSPRPNTCIKRQVALPNPTRTLTRLNSHRLHPVVSTDLYAPNGGGCSMLEPMQHQYQVPSVISIKRLEGPNDEDAHSEISLEEVFKNMSSISASSSSGAAQSSFTEFSEPSKNNNNKWADDGWSYPAAATKSCMPTTVSALGASDSSGSISWPTDEEGDGSSSSDSSSEESDAPDIGILHHYQRAALAAHVPPMQLTAAKKKKKQPWVCAYDDGSEYFKSELTCGGFKFWSGGEVHLRNLGEKGLLKAARDEENSRRNVGVQEKEARA